MGSFPDYFKPRRLQIKDTYIQFMHKTTLFYVLLTILICDAAPKGGRGGGARGRVRGGRGGIGLYGDGEPGLGWLEIIYISLITFKIVFCVCNCCCDCDSICDPDDSDSYLPDEVNH